MEIILDLMLPDSNDDPTHASQAPMVPRISLAGGLDFGFPFLGKFILPLRKPPTVPEVAVNKHRDLDIPENEVRPAWQVAGMAVPINFVRFQSSGHGPFRSCVLTTNASHDGTASFRRHEIAAMSTLW